MGDNTVIVENPYDDIAQTEGEAGSAITPGHAIEMAADGEWDPLGTAASATAEPAFADLSVDPDDDKGDAYDVGEQVRIFYARAGMVLDVLVAANENIAVGDILVPAADGTFTEKAGDTTEDDSRLMLKATEAATDTSIFRCNARVI